MKTITAQKIPKKIATLSRHQKNNQKEQQSSMVFLGHHNWSLVKIF